MEACYYQVLRFRNHFKLYSRLLRYWKCFVNKRNVNSSSTKTLSTV